jgi:hypothetical protein
VQVPSFILYLFLNVYINTRIYPRKRWPKIIIKPRQGKSSSSAAPAPETNAARSVVEEEEGSEAEAERPSEPEGDEKAKGDEGDGIKGDEDDDKENGQARR